MNRPRTSPHPEAGYILLAVLFMVALLLVTLAVAAPRIAADIQRDKEAELIHRGEQYKHAIKLYYKKFGRYPTSIDQLEDTNKMRFLRKRYADPMTGKDDWKIIHQGEAHVKAMGLFGQPIQNGGLSATAGSTAIGGAPSLTGSSSTLGGTSTISPTSSSTDSSSSSSSSSTDSSTSSSSTTGSSTSPFGGTSASTFGSGQTMGGAPMVGIVSKNAKASIKEYKQQKHYNEWEFVYDPVEDLMNSVSLFGGGNTNLNGNSGSPNTLSNPGTGTGTGFGTGTGSSGSFGGGFSSSPSPSPSPQQ